MAVEAMVDAQQMDGLFGRLCIDPLWACGVFDGACQAFGVVCELEDDGEGSATGVSDLPSFIASGPYEARGRGNAGTVQK